MRGRGRNHVASESISAILETFFFVFLASQQMLPGEGRRKEGRGGQGARSACALLLAHPPALLLTEIGLAAGKG